MRKSRTWALALVLAFMALVVGGCGDDDDEEAAAGATTTVAKGRIVVGSTNFPEQLIVANMYAQVLEHHGFDVELRPNLGNREIVQPALQNGEIDLLPEYVGTLLEFLQTGSATPDVDQSVAKLRELLAPKGLTALEPAPAVDANALVVTRKTATERNLTKISDLAPIADTLVLGGPPECPTRPLCLIGFEGVYGLKFKEFKALDAGGPITKEALERGQIDVALLFSSDGAIPARGFVVLEDDRRLQPAENVIPVIRTEKVTPDLEEALNELSAKLTTEELSELNKAVDVDKADPDDVAESFLEEQKLLR
ncbi:MAG TPA: ABC transporter substrate-binding protein [Acidimicrobiales bacterium]|nr:ABC transporter substrate-binding protein [Acidimicrobiales bacterium]